MRPTQHQQYFYAQQQQLAQQQAAWQLNSGLPLLQQQQQHSSNAPYHSPSPHYGQQARNGLQVMGGLPLGGAATVMPGTHIGVLPLQNGLLQQQQWSHLRPESQAWGQGVFPSSQQGLVQPALIQQHIQQQQQQAAYLQEIRTASGGLNGVAPLPQVRGGDRMRGNQKWGAHQHDGNGQFRDASMFQDSRRPLDGLRPNEFFSRDSSHGGGHSHGHGNSHNKPYDNNSRSSGNWSRGGGGGGGGGATNYRSRGGKNDKGRGAEPARSQAVVSLRCDACDRSFTNSQQFTAHNRTHVKCDVQGCLFEASGRVVKEHKQSTHDISASDMQLSSKLFKSKESEEEVVRWREERRRNYPTTSNVKRKAEEMIARKARGELVDEDARKRKERLKEILAKQAELGLPVAEVPAYYMSDRYGSLKGKGGRGESSGSGPNDNRRKGKRSHDHANVAGGIPKEEDKEPPAKAARIILGSNDSAEPSPNACELEVETTKEIPTTIEVKEQPGFEVVEQDSILKDEKDQKVPTKASEKLCYFFKRGRCKKGNRCEFLHERRPKKKKEVASAQPAPKRAPTLLAKLLDADIRKEKSHLLQSFRFFVNNMFLLEFPEKPLKFFNWQEGNDRSSDAEAARAKQEALAIKLEGETDTDNDMQSSPEEQDSGEVARLDGEDQKGVIGTDENTQSSPEEQDSGKLARLDEEAQEGVTGTDETTRTSNEELDSEEVTRLDGESQEGVNGTDENTQISDEEQDSDDLARLVGEAEEVVGFDETTQTSDEEQDSGELTMLDGEADEGVTGNDEMQTSHEEQDSGEVTRLDGEEVEGGSFEYSYLAGQDAEEGNGTDEDFEIPHEEYMTSDVAAWSDDDEFDC